MSRRDQPCCCRCKARNLRHSSPSAGRKSWASIPIFYAATGVTFIARRSVAPAPATLALLFLFFLGGCQQLVESPKIDGVRFAQVLADFPQRGGGGYLD